MYFFRENDKTKTSISAMCLCESAWWCRVQKLASSSQVRNISIPLRIVCVCLSSSHLHYNILLYIHITCPFRESVYPTASNQIRGGLSERIHETTQNVALRCVRNLKPSYRIDRSGSHFGLRKNWKKNYGQIFAMFRNEPPPVDWNQQVVAWFTSNIKSDNFSWVPSKLFIL